MTNPEFLYGRAPSLEAVQNAINEADAQVIPVLTGLGEIVLQGRLPRKPRFYILKEDVFLSEPIVVAKAAEKQQALKIKDALTKQSELEEIEDFPLDTRYYIFTENYSLVA